MRFESITVSDIALSMNLTVSALYDFAQNLDDGFHPTRLSRERGKFRQIDAPKPGVKKKLRKLHRFLQRNAPAHPCAHGGAKGRSTFTSARLHLGKRFVVTRDIRDCYPSISRFALQESLARLGFADDAASLLSKLLTVRNRVAQGSPVSPDAINLYFYKTDRALSAYCRSKRLSYGRNSDDFVISGDSQFAAELPGNAIAKQISALGLVINEDKLRKRGFQPNHKPQFVHGLVVNNRRGLRIAPAQAKEGVELAEAFVRGSKVVSPESLQGLAYKRSRVVGWMHYCRQADFGPAQHIRKLLDAGDRNVRRALTELRLRSRKKWWLALPASSNLRKRSPQPIAS